MPRLTQTAERLEHERRVLTTQAAVLESVARGVALPDVLEQLCELIEGHAPGAICSVLLFEESTGTLRTAAGSSLPPEYAAALDGIEPGEGAGSCGTAAARGEPVIVCDIATDPLWDSFRDLALRFGIRSCWSSPILGPGRAVLGTFAISHGEPREPSTEQLALLQTASHLAGLAVERDQVQRTKESLSLELQNRQRLESLGVLAGGIAHDFNNLMTAVLGNLSLAADTVTDSETLSYLKAAEEACEQSKILSSRFLSFARGGAPQREPVDLADVVREACSFALAGSDLACEWTGAPGLPAVDGDRSQLIQLLSNLLLNADQATPGGGLAMVGARVRHVARGDLATLEPGHYVVLSVRDSGDGIAPEHLDRVFEPYFTLRDAGSGLGLATVHSIVRAHGGHIGVESQLGRGTTFTIHLPAAEGAAVQPMVAVPDLARGRGRVLLMDDEPAVLRVATAFLERAGYSVEAVAEGDTAIARFTEAHEAGEPFDAVVLDLTVRSGLGGKAAVTLMRQVDPGIAAVVASGYSSDDILSSPDEHGFDSAVPKPFHQSDLVGGVQRALEARRR
ncbi:MAG: GAF domain-containing protein [Deltaproteobacteria bacterium]|nr:GAF domain-containing protein [Deltaproteobacteria bacterium]MBW2447852.1 GAF domain-containing protein [Deltaproteobacteria bacterium]